MAKAQPAQQTKITRGDLESKFRAFQGEIQDKVDDKKQTLLAAGAGVGDVPDARVLPPRDVAAARRRRRWSRSAGSDRCQPAAARCRRQR